MDRELRRGEVYIAKLPQKENSRIQGGKRPVVIFSNDKNNTYSEIVHYIPLTAQQKKADLPVHIKLNVNFLPKSSIALCEQIDLEEKGNLLSYIDWDMGCVGKFQEADMQRISYGVAIQLGFVPMLKPNTYNQYAMA
jgi:mRNA-degrading endonuclease toxin of MazEF toxin-antitoxin module